VAQFLPKMYLGASKPRGRNSNLSQQRLLMSEGEVQQRLLMSEGEVQQRLLMSEGDDP
jgi:hypothetical protein